MGGVMKTYAAQLLRYPDMGITLDFSKLPLSESYVEEMKPLVERAFAEMAQLEGGAIANPDEGRMVGHYWLRNSALAPSAELKAKIDEPLHDLKAFAEEVKSGSIRTPKGEKYTTCLVIGIGGSALGPELVADALPSDGLTMRFLDNTDPDGMYQVLESLPLETTLAVVISKSGGTPETRNGMVCAQDYFAKHGVAFAPQAVAVTGVGSKLDQVAVAEGWLKRFPMEDWVGGRTSEMSVVGLVPAALQGVDIDSMLRGAAEMDAHTRTADVATNAAMKLALAWYAAGSGHGSKDMVVLPWPLPAAYQASASFMAALAAKSAVRVWASISAAPCSRESISTPCSAAGTSPTTEVSDVRPPTQSSMGKRFNQPSATAT